KEGLVANRILSCYGIVNGTCNYILSKMTDAGEDFAVVLKEAQAHGYAEADPTFDVEGVDSAHKLQILASLAFRTYVELKDIYTEGIASVTAQDIAYARELGYRIKLLAIAKSSDGGIEVRVHPTMIRERSPLAAVSGVFNAVFITGDSVGDLMFYGRGAGQMPTASAVLSDTVEIATRLAHGVPALHLDLPTGARHARGAGGHRPSTRGRGAHDDDQGRKCVARAATCRRARHALLRAMASPARPAGRTLRGGAAPPAARHERVAGDHRAVPGVS